MPKNTGWQEYRLRIRIGARLQWRLGLSSCHSTVPPQTSYTPWIPFNLKGERAGKSIKTPIEQVSQLNYHQLKCKRQGIIMAGAIQRPDRKKRACVNQRADVRNWSLQSDRSRPKMQATSEESLEDSGVQSSPHSGGEAARDTEGRETRPRRVPEPQRTLHLHLRPVN